MTRSIIVIGGGAAGVATARDLLKKGFKPIILEKNPYIGGMCSTYQDASSSAIADSGAAIVASNYSLLSAMRELKVHALPKAPIAPMGWMKQFQQEGIPGQSSFSKLAFYLRFGAKYLKEMVSFSADVFWYRRYKQQRREMPKEYLSSFSDYIRDRGISHSIDAYRGLIPGCGYGAFESVPTWLVFEYFGYTTIPLTSLSSSNWRIVEGGYQNIIEKMAVGIETYCNADITSVVRDAKGENPIEVQFIHNGEQKSLSASRLVLATSPETWPELGMALTPVEQECVDNLHLQPYPIALCKIKNIPYEYYFNESALSTRGFDHAALLTTRDGRHAPEDGRLCTLYFNTNENTDLSQFASPEAIKDLIVQDFGSQIPSLTSQDIEVKEIKIWPNYFRYVDLATRFRIADTQGEQHTYKVGSYLTYEDVACAIDSTHSVVTQISQTTPSRVSAFTQTLRNFLFFYSSAPDATRGNTPESRPEDENQHQKALGSR